MKSRFNRQLDTLLRVRAFGEAHSDLFPPSTLPGQMFAVIAEAIPELRNHAGLQVAGQGLARAGVTLKAEAREDLRERIVDIARTARSIGVEQPEIQSTFRLPYDMSDSALISGARGFAQQAQPLVDVFVAHQLPSSFLQDLEGAIARFEAAIAGHVDKRKVQTNATASIDATMEKAMDALHRLDGMVPNKIKGDSVVLKDWDASRRIASGRVSKPSEPASTPTPSVASATAA